MLQYFRCSTLLEPYTMYVKQRSKKMYPPDSKIEVSTETRPNLLWWHNVTLFPRIEKANIDVTPFRSASGCYIMVLRYSRMFRSVAGLDRHCIHAVFG